MTSKAEIWDIKIWNPGILESWIRVLDLASEPRILDLTLDLASEPRILDLTLEPGPGSLGLVMPGWTMPGWTRTGSTGMARTGPEDPRPPPPWVHLHHPGYHGRSVSWGS